VVSYYFPSRTALVEAIYRYREPTMELRRRALSAILRADQRQRPAQL
jgi:AcrR family transcriptional regulator